MSIKSPCANSLDSYQTLQNTHPPADCSESSSVTSFLGEEWFKPEGPLLQHELSVTSTSSWIKP